MEIMALSGLLQEHILPSSLIVRDIPDLARWGIPGKGGRSALYVISLQGQCQSENLYS